MIPSMLFVLLQSAQVSGLKPGESAVVLPRAADGQAVDDRLFICPRVLDASTGTPLEGVRIETWTEDGVAPLFLQMQLDAAQTGRDGCARVCMKDGAVRSEKVRLSKAGYASLETALSDVFDSEVPMYPARPFEGRVLDLEGHPVAGALVRTRYSCAHAVPASQTRTDAMGRFRMEDFPPMFGGSPEVEVVDASHAPVFQLGADDLRWQASFYGSLDLYVPRSRPTVVQLVDAKGEGLPHRRVFLAEAAVTEGWTDEQGFCRLTPHQLTFEQTYELDDPTGHQVLYPALFVDGLVTRITPFDAADAEKTAGRIKVHLAGLDAMPRPLIVIVPEKGCFREARDGEEVSAPIGPARVFAGGDFTGYLQTSQPVDIGASPREITLQLQAGPRVRVHQDDVGANWSWIQAGDRSSGDASGMMVDEDTWEVGVAPDVPITVFRWLSDDGLRRVTVPPVVGVTDVDMTAGTALVRLGTNEASPQIVVVAYEVRDELGHPLDASRGRCDCGSDWVPGVEGVFEWTLSAHDNFSTEFGAEGFTTVHFEGTVPTQSADRPQKVVLTRRAQLRVGGGVKLLEGFQGQVEPTEDGFAMDAAAGPLTLVVGRDGEPRIVLDLRLAPGESRRIDVK